MQQASALTPTNEEQEFCLKLGRILRRVEEEELPFYLEHYRKSKCKHAAKAFELVTAEINARRA